MSQLQVEYNAKGVAIFTLNRPEKLNALSKQLLDELVAGLFELDKKINGNGARALILRSVTNKAFCVGADLAERKAMDNRGVADILTLQRRTMDALADVRVPTIAVIEGPAFGGGLELALACDMRVAAPTAMMGLVETRLAIIPGAGGTQRLPRLIGEARAKEMILLGKKIDGVQASRIGLVNEVSEKAVEIAAAWTDQICEGAPLATIAAKNAIQNAPRSDLKSALDWERKCYDALIETEDRLEGLAAFGEKRKPKFKGK